MNKDEKAFLSDVIATLVLLVVVIVLSILSAYFVPKEKTSNVGSKQKFTQSNTKSQTQTK